MRVCDSLTFDIFPRFSLRLISFQLKLLQPVEQVPPEADQPSAEAVASSKQCRTFTSFEASRTTNVTLGTRERHR